MAKPTKKNGKWGTEVAGGRVTQGKWGEGDSRSEWISTGPDLITGGGWTEYDEPTQASLELASSRYGVPDAVNTAGNSWDPNHGQTGGSINDLKATLDASNAQWDEQAKTNEGLRSSALSMANTYAQGAAATRAREAEANAGALKVSSNPSVTLKKKGAVQATSAKFRI